jgi:hypothetical protein
MAMGWSMSCAVHQPAASPPSPSYPARLVVDDVLAELAHKLPADTVRVGVVDADYVRQQLDLAFGLLSAPDTRTRAQLMTDLQAAVQAEVGKARWLAVAGIRSTSEEGAAYVVFLGGMPSPAGTGAPPAAPPNGGAVRSPAGTGAPPAAPPNGGAVPSTGGEPRLVTNAKTASVTWPDGIVALCFQPATCGELAGKVGVPIFDASERFAKLRHITKLAERAVFFGALWTQASGASSSSVKATPESWSSLAIGDSIVSSVYVDEASRSTMLAQSADRSVRESLRRWASEQPRDPIWSALARAVVSLADSLQTVFPPPHLEGELIVTRMPRHVLSSPYVTASLGGLSVVMVIAIVMADAFSGVSKSMH